MIRSRKCENKTEIRRREKMTALLLKQFKVIKQRTKFFERPNHNVQHKNSNQFISSVTNTNRIPQKMYFLYFHKFRPKITKINYK